MKFLFLEAPYAMDWKTNKSWIIKKREPEV